MLAVKQYTDNPYAPTEKLVFDGDGKRKELGADNVDDTVTIDNIQYKIYYIDFLFDCVTRFTGAKVLLNNQDERDFIKFEIWQPGEPEYTKLIEYVKRWYVEVDKEDQPCPCLDYSCDLPENFKVRFNYYKASDNVVKFRANLIKHKIVS